MRRQFRDPDLDIMMVETDLTKEEFLRQREEERKAMEEQLEEQKKKGDLKEGMTYPTR